MKRNTYKFKKEYLHTSKNIFYFSFLNIFLYFLVSIRMICVSIIFLHVNKQQVVVRTVIKFHAYANATVSLVWLIQIILWQIKASDIKRFYLISKVELVSWAADHLRWFVCLNLRVLFSTMSTNARKKERKKLLYQNFAVAASISPKLEIIRWYHYLIIYDFD